MILVPRSDLFRPRDFYGFDRFEIAFSVLSPLSPSPSLAKMGHFFLNSLCFR